eukprot:UN28963
MEVGTFFSPLDCECNDQPLYSYYSDYFSNLIYLAEGNEIYVNNQNKRDDLRSWTLTKYSKSGDWSAELDEFVFLRERALLFCITSLLTLLLLAIITYFVENYLRDTVTSLLNIEIESENIDR